MSDLLIISSMRGQAADTQAVRQALADGRVSRSELERLLDLIDAREAEFHSVLGVVLYAKESAEQDAARLRDDCTTRKGSWNH